LGTDVGGDAFSRFQLNVQDRDNRPLCSQREGNGLPNTGAGTGDQGDAPVQSHARWQ
jgi:hypothetical protein